MKSKIFILFIFSSYSAFAQIYNKKELLKNYNAYDIVLKYNNDFNNDKIMDVLYILSSKKENDEALVNNNNSVSKRKAVIYLGKTNENFLRIFENDNIFPCRECVGKSDNDISDLRFENNILSYKTTIAPFASNNYSVIDFSLKFSQNSFKLYKYEETYYKVDEDNDATIKLDDRDIAKIKFNYYDWIANNSWNDHVLVTNQNVKKLNDFAYSLGNINPSFAIDLLQKIIKKYPNRFVVYLNLADNYWAINKKDLAKENYKKYIALMKSQNKDLKKIPQEVWERAE